MQTKPKTIDTLLSTCTPQIYRVCYLYLAAVSYHACDTENSYFVHTKLLPSIELGVMHELNSSNEKMYARDLSEELDISSHLIAKRAKKLDEDKGLINRDRSEQLIKYSISKKAIAEYFNSN